MLTNHLNKNIFTELSFDNFFLFLRTRVSDGFSVLLLNKKRSIGNLRCCFHWSSGSFFGVLALISSKSSQTTLGTTVQDSLAILVNLKLDNQELWWMDSNVNVGSIGLLSLYSFNVYNELLAVNLNNFADLVSLVVTSNYLKS